MPIRSHILLQTSALYFTVLCATASEYVYANAIDIGGDGSQVWEVCAMCHGVDGISAMQKFPNLAGQNYDYLVKQIKDFREQRRTNDGGQMAAISTEVDEADIDGIARYFSDLPRPNKTTKLDSSELTRHHSGRQLYQKHCSSCHDNMNTAPLLKGQHQRYLIKQLQDFQSGSRANDIAQKMQNITQNLDTNRLQDITFYLSTHSSVEG